MFFVLLWLLLWPNNKNDGVKTVVKKITEPNAEFSMDGVNKINWNGLVAKDYPSTEVALVELNITDTNKKIEIRNILKASSPALFNFDDNRNLFEFSKNITNASQITKGKLKVNDIKAIFLETMVKIETNETKIEETSFKQYLNPWWVSSDEIKADAIEVLANYYYKNLAVKTFSGYMIKADYFTDGTLVKMENQLPFGKIIKTENKKLLTINDLIKISSDKFKIWRVDGGSEYELSGETPSIDEVKVTEYELEYIYDVKTGILWPYYFIKGESQLTTGVAKVTLIISAVKEE